MNFNNLLLRSLNETVRQIGNRFYIYSHKTPGKRLGKKEGYATRGAAVRNMMIVASHGGFAKNKRKASVVHSYIKRHMKEETLNEHHEEIMFVASVISLLLGGAVSAKFLGKFISDKVSGFFIRQSHARSYAKDALHFGSDPHKVAEFVRKDPRIRGYIQDFLNASDAKEKLATISSITKLVHEKMHEMKGEK